MTENFRDYLDEVRNSIYIEKEKREEKQKLERDSAEVFSKSAQDFIYKNVKTLLVHAKDLLEEESFVAEIVLPNPSSRSTSTTMRVKSADRREDYNWEAHFIEKGNLIDIQTSHKGDVLSQREVQFSDEAAKVLSESVTEFVRKILSDYILGTDD